ncbi:MAG: serine/threonine protein kinase [Kiritimatiellae bacterium]|nr:serine/threonine protein kinase [Kiritimatiellia bacterium]
MTGTVNFRLPNFEILQLLGRGGMASVWKARQISLDRLVAVKILSSSFSSNEEDIDRFSREARVAALLKHPGIVEIYDANYANGMYYYVMEYIAGYTFGALLRRKGRISEDDVLTIAENVAVALDYAWETYQLIHCDIKPDNIMVDSDGTVKLTDLGLCHALKLNRKDDGTSETDEILGTPAYMSPEQIYADRPLDCRSDIYELGATLYHLASGRMLFQGVPDAEMVKCHVGETQAPNILTVAGNCTIRFALLLERMLAKDPENRHQNWKQVIADLKRIRAGANPWHVKLPQHGSSMAWQ